MKNKLVKLSKLGKITKLEALWFMLISITLFNASLGDHFNSVLFVSVIIALTTMFKGMMIIDHFMELKHGNKILRWLMRGYFIVFPMLIIITIFL